ncbi:MAG TPA: IPT/TIG domain-containing protein [Pyrinomonadaceae bacterium]
MKFLEGKSQAERKKIITAIALGAVTICALFYTFVLSGGGRSSANANNRNNSNRATANSNSRNSNNTAQQISQIDQPSIDETLLMPIPDNPFPPISDGAASRNIFAFSEPTPFVPKPAVIPTEKPTPPPTPAPTPPIFAAGLNPGMVYAQTGNFKLEIGGDKFTPDSRIYFGGMELQTQFVNPQRLTAQVPAQLISSEGEREIVVRSPSDPKMYSNPLKINVQAPPVPEFSFVGLVARRRANNDTALLQNKKTKEYISVRLNDTVPDRFRVFSISSREVVVMDTALKLRHVLGFVDEKDAGGGNTGGSAPGGRDGIRGGRMNQPNPNYNPNVPNVQYQSIPGIPDNIPRYVPPQPVQTPPPSKKNNDDEDDNDPNR